MGKFFKEVEFNNLLAKLMRVNPDFSDVTQEPSFTIGDRVACPDFLCKYKGKNTLLSVKEYRLLLSFEFLTILIS